MFLQAKDIQYLKNEFSKLKKDVYMTLFTTELGCQYCKDEEVLLNEVLQTSDKLHLEVKNINIDKEDAARYQITGAPTLVLREKDKDFGITFMGIPAGHEFSAFLADIMMIGTEEHGLSQDTLMKLASVPKAADLLVFVTPSCPYCPSAVHMGHKLAYVKENWRSAMVEAMEFPDLSQRFEVQAVPRIVINQDAYFEGAMPETMFVDLIIKGLQGVTTGPNGVRKLGMSARRPVV